MPAYKDKAKGTWYASFYFENWTGKKEKKMKRGFKTKREALEWERTFLQQQTADLDMTFESFVALYAADVKGRIKENTWGTKEHILYKKLAGQEQRLKELAPAVKNMERLAAEFSADPEEVLPEPGPLESARAYREKKAKPLWAKIVKVLRSVYRAYLDLKSKFERLQADYGREVSKNSSLSERIYEVCAERDSLKGKVRDYERVRRAIGPEQADRILEAAYQQEQAEKERKRAARQKTRVGVR